MKNKQIGTKKNHQMTPFITTEIYTGVLAKTFEPNISVIFQRIFVKFKMQIF
jgi:hypothetical protein